MSLQRILDDLAAHVQHRLDEGETVVEMSPAALAALKQKPASVGGTAASPSAAREPRALQSATHDAPHGGTAAPPSAAPTLSSRGLPAEAGRGQSEGLPYTRFGTTPELDAIAARVAACRNCGLCQKRTQVVPGQGNPHPELVFVGEGPGEDEDLQGLAFVGRAGQLLTRMIAAMGLTREAVWIGNVVKCRPPGNRTPEPEEMAACLPYLREQLALLKPKVIVALGATAVKGLVNPTLGITKLRGKWLAFDGIPLMPTFHPSFLLRGGGEGKDRYWDVWDDLCEVLRRLNRPVPERKR